MTEWPDETTLRAILDLPGVSGQTIAVVERYLADSQGYQRRYYADLPAEPEKVNNEMEWESLRGQWGQACELVRAGWKSSREMGDELARVVQAHWGQLVDLGKM